MHRCNKLFPLPVCHCLSGTPSSAIRSCSGLFSTRTRRYRNLSRTLSQINTSVSPFQVINHGIGTIHNLGNHRRESLPAAVPLNHGQIVRHTGSSSTINRHFSQVRPGKILFMGQRDSSCSYRPPAETVPTFSCMTTSFCHSEISYWDPENHVQLSGENRCRTISQPLAFSTNVSYLGKRFWKNVVGRKHHEIGIVGYPEPPHKPSFHFAGEEPGLVNALKNEVESLPPFSGNPLIPALCQVKLFLFPAEKGKPPDSFPAGAILLLIVDCEVCIYSAA